MYMHTYIAMGRAMYLEELLAPRNFFLITIMTITIHNTKLMMTTADTVPAIVGSGVELEEDDVPVIVGCSITVRIVDTRVLHM